MELEEEWRENEKSGLIRCCFGKTEHGPANLALMNGPALLLGGIAIG